MDSGINITNHRVSRMGSTLVGTFQWEIDADTTYPTARKFDFAVTDVDGFPPGCVDPTWMQVEQSQSIDNYTIEYRFHEEDLRIYVEDVSAEAPDADTGQTSHVLAGAALPTMTGTAVYHTHLKTMKDDA